MLSKNQIKLVHSLQSKKGRDKEGCFVAEGPKVVSDLMEILKPKMFFATQGWIDSNPQIDNDIVVVTDDELRKISFLQHPQGVLAVFPMLVSQPKCDFDDSSLYIALDGVQDPGNLGTILRTGEGAGIDGVIMTKETADLFNPKVIRATMGSIYRMPYLYVDDILTCIEELKSRDIAVYAAHLDDSVCYDVPDYKKGTAFLIGNEGNGLKKETADKASQYIKIPMQGQVESLNAAIATSILMYEAAKQRNNAK